MITLEVRGFEEVEALLAKWERLLQSDELWGPASQAAGDVLRRFAANISPVVTGAYQGAHIVIQERMGATMTIDSGAINPRSGEPVTRYAGPVEGYHAVYQRTFDQASGRAGAAGMEVIMERLK